jgi:hypothetical protein
LWVGLFGVARLVVMQLQLSWDRGAFGGGVGFRVWYRS